MPNSRFEEFGHQYFPDLLPVETVRIVSILFENEQVGAGKRLKSAGILTTLLSPEGEAGQVASRLLGEGARPVRLILFDKNAQNNWTVGWHQDRVIAVRQRLAVGGYQNWSVKDGTLHVRPPFELLSRMVTLRIHIDAVDETNAPLLVLDGSHRLGPLTKSEVQAAADSHAVTVCTAERGGIWAYRTPILHASKPSDPPRRRRTIQIDNAPCDPDGGLEWAFSL